MKKAIALSLCSILGFESFTCPVALLRDTRTLAATPPSTLIAQDIFGGDSNNTPPPQNDIFQDGGGTSTPPSTDIFGNTNPGETDIDSGSPTSEVEIQNNENSIVIRSDSVSFREMESSVYEVIQHSPDDCLVRRILDARGTNPYVTFIEVQPLNINSCPVQETIELNFSENRDRAELSLQSGDRFIISYASEMDINIEYINQLGHIEHYQVPISRERSVTHQNKNQTSDTQNHLPQSEFSQFEVAGVDNIIADLSCGLCNALKTVWDITMGRSSHDIYNASFVDSVLTDALPTFNFLSNAASRVGAGGMFIVGRLFNLLVDINNQLEKNNQLGVDCQTVPMGNQTYSCDSEPIRLVTESQGEAPVITSFTCNGRSDECPPLPIGQTFELSFTYEDTDGDASQWEMASWNGQIASQDGSRGSVTRTGGPVCCEHDYCYPETGELTLVITDSSGLSSQRSLRFSTTDGNRFPCENTFREEVPQSQEQPSLPSGSGTCGENTFVLPEDESIVREICRDPSIQGVMTCFWDQPRFQSCIPYR
jgi:hypothetical protein